MLPKKLLKKAPSGPFGKAVRLPVCQDDHASTSGWCQNDRSPETGICTIVINKVHAANVSGEPAQRIVEVLNTSGRRPVRPHSDLRTMQLSHHLCGDYPVPCQHSVVELQQRVVGNFTNASVDAARRRQGLQVLETAPRYRHFARDGVMAIRLGSVGRLLQPERPE